MGSEQGRGSSVDLAEAFKPVVEEMVGLTEAQIQRALKPLEERIAELEAQVAKLTEGSEP